MDLSEKENKQFDDWKNKRIGTIADSFKEVIEKSGPISLGNFSFAVSRFAEGTFKEFAKEIGLNDAIKIPEQFLPHLFTTFIGGFNSVLPRDYQYIVVSVFSEISQNMRIGSAKRKRVIPGAHDIITTRIVPIIKVKNIKLPDGDVAIEDFEITDVKFGNVDDLEKFI